MADMHDYEYMEVESYRVENGVTLVSLIPGREPSHFFPGRIFLRLPLGVPEIRRGDSVTFQTETTSWTRDQPTFITGEDGNRYVNYHSFNSLSISRTDTPRFYYNRGEFLFADPPQ